MNGYVDLKHSPGVRDFRFSDNKTFEPRDKTSLLHPANPLQSAMAIAPETPYASVLYSLLVYFRELRT